MKLKLWSAGVALLVLPLTPLEAQSVRPFESWLGFGIQQRLDYGLEIGIESQERLSSSEVSPQLRRWEFGPMLTWRYSPRYDFLLGYERSTDWTPEKETMNTDTAVTGFVVHLPWGQWNLDSRQRIDTGANDASKIVAEFRHQVQLRYSGLSKRWTPYLKNEWFLDLTRSEVMENRASLGIEYRILDPVGIELYAMRRDLLEENAFVPLVGLNLNLNF